MVIEGRQLQVHPGDGVVGRFGDVVIVVLAGGDDAFVDALLDLAERVGTSGESGKTFTRGLARFLLEHEEGAAPFAAVSAHDRGLAVMVSGDATDQSSKLSQHPERAVSRIFIPRRVAA